MLISGISNGAPICTCLFCRIYGLKTHRWGLKILQGRNEISHSDNGMKIPGGINNSAGEE